MKLHFWFVRAMSHLVPRRWRSEWKQEWDAELQHRDVQGRSGLFGHSLGAFWDALAMQPRRFEEEVFQDLRFGARMFAKNKVLTLTAVLSLALGIGANTALFSMIDAVLLKKLPVKNPDELILFEWVGSPSGIMTSMTTDRNVLPKLGGGDTFSYPAFEQFRVHNKTLSEVFGFAKPYSASLIADDQAEVGTGQWVSGGFFAGLGVGTTLGRTITLDDDKPSSTPVAVISHLYWQRRFASDASVIGKTIRINNSPFTIVGVAEPNFAGTLQVDEAPDVFIPLSSGLIGGSSRLSDPYAWWIYVMGRTKPGTDLEQVRGNLQGIFNQTNSETARLRPAKSGPPQDEPPRLGFSAGSRGLVENREVFKRPLLILMLLVGVVLIVACANVANLLLARAATRQKEIAVRISMGARRFRLIRQVLTESVLLIVQVALSVVLLIGAGLFVRTMRNFHNVVEGYDPQHVLQFDMQFWVLALRELRAATSGAFFSGWRPIMQSPSLLQSL